MQTEIELSQNVFVQEIISLKKEGDSFRPLAKEIEERIMQKLRLNWNYHSNSIEGNPYNYGETVALLMHGITAQGKSLKDHLDIQGHNDAINFLLSLIKEERNFSETDLRLLHKLLLVKEYESDAITPDGKPTKKIIRIGSYKTEPNNVRTVTGEMHYYISPEETPAKMKELMEWFTTSKKNPEIHPVVFAAVFHYKFVAIHPFDDGNGRMARLLMNLVLLKNNFPPVVIKTSDKKNYFSKLSQADAGDIKPFVEYVSDNLKFSMQLWIKGAKGESIDEKSDIDKEIALFKAGLNKGEITEVAKSKEVLEKVFSESVIPLFLNLKTLLHQFDDLFDKVRCNTQAQGKLQVGVVGQIELDISNYRGLFFEPTNGINFSYQYDTFKNFVKQKNIFLDIGVNFEKYRYVIYNSFSTDKNIIKAYNEFLSQEEINQISHSAVRFVMDELKK